MFWGQLYHCRITNLYINHRSSDSKRMCRECVSVNLTEHRLSCQKLCFTTEAVRTIRNVFLLQTMPPNWMLSSSWRLEVVFNWERSSLRNSKGQWCLLQRNTGDLSLIVSIPKTFAFPLLCIFGHFITMEQSENWQLPVTDANEALWLQIRNCLMRNFTDCQRKKKFFLTFATLIPSRVPCCQITAITTYPGSDLLGQFNTYSCPVREDAVLGL